MAEVRWLSGDRANRSHGSDRCKYGQIRRQKKLEETVLKINLEAAAEIARQLRLRNLSGIIMVDFIDMNQEAHKEALMDALRAAVAKDPVKTVVVEMTRLNLVEITRKS